jgi:hypothetical protein
MARVTVSLCLDRLSLARHYGKFPPAVEKYHVGSTSCLYGLLALQRAMAHFNTPCYF